MGDKKYYFSLPLVGKLLKIKALLFLSSLRDMMENALLQGLHLNLIHLVQQVSIKGRHTPGAALDTWVVSGDRTG